MRIVVALGGNALLRRGEHADAAVQLAHVREAARSLARLATHHEVLICHGNGPQIGLLATESANDPVLEGPYPLDALGAQTQGMIGYWLCQGLRNAGVSGHVVALVSQTVVAADDPAFEHPEKFVGPVLDRDQAGTLAHERGWDVARDGDHWRRVVPSPLPRRIVEQELATSLLDQHVTVVCGGGGGAPVVEDQDGILTGVEAVVDKDLVAAMLAVEVGADRLLVLTDVSAVMSDFGTPDERRIARLAAKDLSPDDFAAGSMGPKIGACAGFVRLTGNEAAIGALEDAEAVLVGIAGTTIATTAAFVGSGR
ncbi:MAG: carbamate kinase [Nocardioidaceae bacterium]|nr:carbamate kinase [Nocardioidaceae bacterium]